MCNSCGVQKDTMSRESLKEGGLRTPGPAKEASRPLGLGCSQWPTVHADGTWHCGVHFLRPSRRTLLAFSWLTKSSPRRWRGCILIALYARSTNERVEEKGDLNCGCPFRVSITYFSREGVKIFFQRIGFLIRVMVGDDFWLCFNLEV